jgi:hypothetical protein
MSVFKKNKKLEDLSDFDKRYAVCVNGYVQSYINPEMLNQQKISEDSEQFANIKQTQSKRIQIFMEMEKTENLQKLSALDQEFTANEFYLQKQWGFKENIDFHRFWDAPKCSCPKADNDDNYPTGFYHFNQICKIHGHRFK